MPSKKLITFLEEMPPRDLRRFQKYLDSPFFNENEDLRRLLGLLLPHLGQPQQAPQLEKKKIWKKLYPKQPFDDATLRRYCSELLRHAFHYSFLQQQQSQPQEELIAILGQLEHPRLDIHLNGLLRRAEDLLARSPLRNASYHHQRFRLARAAHHKLERSGSKRIDYEHLESADRHLECYYLLEKLKHYCDALDYQNTLPGEANITLPADLFARVRQLEEEPAIRAYYLVSQMLLRPGEEPFFQQLKTLLKNEVGRFSPEEQRALYTYLFNYCIDTKINRGKYSYFQELFDVYQTALDHGILLKNDILSSQDYKNIITVGLHIKAFDWVEQFIREYTGKLPSENQANALTYNLGKVYFHRGQYDKVIEQLREVEYRDLVYALGGKLMLLKTYFELDEYLALDSLIDSFRVYLQRNRAISREVKQQYLNVLRFTRKISRLAPFDQEALTRTRQQIEECKALAAKQWLLEKVAELEKQPSH